MKIWVDAQLPPTLANWLTNTFGLEAAALRDLSQGEMIVEISNAP
jgi:predicted nuclease of predicted toxin-antitoxin system